MRRFFTLLFFLYSFFHSQAQVAPALYEKVEEEIFQVVDEKATPYDGLSNFSLKFLSKLDTSHITTVSGELLIRIVFVVEKDGSISHISIINDTHNLEDQVKKLLLSMPKWKPAKKNGIAVRSKFNWPINFRVGKME